MVRGKTWVEAGPGLVSSPEENGGEGKKEEEESKPPAGRAASRPLASQLAASDGAVAQARLTQNQLSQKKNTVQQSVSLGKCLLMTKSHLGPFGSFPFTEQATKTAPR